MIKVGIVGGSGLVGLNLIKLLSKHKYAKVKIVTSTTQVGKNVPKTNLVFSSFSIKKLNNMDVVFLAIPHGKAKLLVPKLKCKVIDLTADHRLTNTYGIPEVFSNKIKHSYLVANPGCYATACILATYPIKDLVNYAVFDCISGYSGGGKKAKKKYDYENNIIAYKLTDHFHKEEISNVLPFGISFTPHVVNTFSGIMCTAHVFLNDKINLEELKQAYKKFYKGTFTKIADKIPCTKDVAKTSFCHVGGFKIDENNQLVIVSVIDNLFKGAASQAIENMNLMFGISHDEGLT